MAAHSNPILIVGAGLTGSLTALALIKWRPDVAFVLIDRELRSGGGPILPFFLGSIPLANGALIDPLIVRRWTGYYAAGLTFSTLALGRTAYLVPEQLYAELLQKVPAERRLLGKEVVGIESGGVSLADGRFLPASVVLDMRGDAAHSQSGRAWRQTTTRVLRFPKRYDLDRPILVDATFPGSEWTFLQYFPLDPHTLLVQYINYSHDPTLRPVDPVALETEGGHLFDESVRIERLLGDPGFAPVDEGTAPIVTQSSRAELWNPVLSSSVAGATRIAKTIATASEMSNGVLRVRIKELEARARGYRHKCAPLIERLCISNPSVGSTIFERLYGLGQEAVGRFEESDVSSDDLNKLANRPPKTGF